MLTLDQIKTAHAKVRSGADFPRYIQELKSLGLLSYDCQVADGSIAYRGKDGIYLQSEARYAAQPVADEGNATALETSLRIHQAGGSDYPTFCREAADAGVEKWTVDTVRMTCGYFDKKGKLLVEEMIPDAAL